MAQIAQQLAEESTEGRSPTVSGGTPTRPEIGPSRIERLVRAFAWAFQPPAESPELLLLTARVFKIRR